MEEQKKSKDTLNEHIKTMKAILMQAEQDAKQQLINKTFVDQYIDKIFVTSEDVRIVLNIKIFTGEVLDKTLCDLKVRMGHTFKIINNYKDFKNITLLAYFNDGQEQIIP